MFQYYVGNMAEVWLLLQVVSSYGHEPVATSAMLAYHCCLPLLEGEAAYDTLTHWEARAC